MTNNLINLNIEISSIELLQESFFKIADDILNKYYLELKQNRYRVTKIEFYYYNKEMHKDKNTHASKYKRAKQRQILSNEWYLHKVTINDKCRYKGIDYTFGDGKNYGGILIKEVYSLDENKKLSQSKFIDEIIKKTNPSSENEFLRMIEDDKLLKFVVDETINRYEIKTSKRKGLKNDDEFKDKPYAYSVDFI